MLCSLCKKNQAENCLDIGFRHTFMKWSKNPRLISLKAFIIIVDLPPPVGFVAQ